MKTPCRGGRFAAALAIALVWCAQLHARGAAAANLLVNDTADNGDANPGDGTCASRAGRCTLRAAIEESNASAGEDSILLPSGFYKLVHGELQVRDALIVSVTGAGPAILDAGFRSRILAVLSPAHLVASGLRLQHGRHFDCGGAVYNAHGAILMLQSSALARNRVISTENFPPGYHPIGDWPSGGALCNEGTATLSDVQVSRNSVRGYYETAGGGGIENLYSATLSLHDVVITGNRVRVTSDSSAEGGGISNDGVLSFNTLILRRNSTRGTSSTGGGLLDVGYLSGSNLSAVGNLALRLGEEGDDAEGGGVALYGSVDVSGLTVSHNSAIARRGEAYGGGIDILGNDVELRDIVVTYNQAQGCEAEGGGLEIGSSATLSDGLVGENRAVIKRAEDCSTPYGGGIDVNAAGVTLNNLVIAYNRASGQGAVDGGVSGGAVLNNVVITNNIPR